MSSEIRSTDCLSLTTRRAINRIGQKSQAPSQHFSSPFKSPGEQLLLLFEEIEGYRRNMKAAKFFVLAALVLALLPNPALAQEKNIAKYVRFKKGELIAYGIVEGKQVRQISGDLFAAWYKTDEMHALSDVELLTPTEPRTVLAVALNYKSHVGQTSEQVIPAVPQYFFKPVSCLIANNQAIVIPPGTTNVHYEAEMVIVIGKETRQVPPDEAMAHVFGVTCGNDISARDWQEQDLQWWRAKGTDTFGPCGPFIVSGVNYDDLLLRLRLNGEIKDEQRTSEMVRNVAELVSFASQHITLKPGDLIYTGTFGITAPIKAGDVVEVELEHAGTLTNPVTARN